MILLASALLLAGCGLRPVYGKDSGFNAGNAGPIRVAEIPGRTGFELRKALIRELEVGLPGIDEPALLTVTVNEKLRRLAFEPDGAASRASVRAAGRYSLELGDGTTHQGDAIGEAFFNVPPNAPYGDIAAQSAAGDRAADVLARNIVQDLRLQLVGAR